MSQRIEFLVRRLRRLLLSAGYVAGVLYFWLGAHEVFEGPKTQAAALYGVLLAALSRPLLAARLGWAWRRWRRPLQLGGLLVGAVLLSWLGAFASLPGNLLLPIERSLPLLLAAFSALVWWMEDREQQDAVLFSVFAAHWGLLFYGLLQVLDQNWGAAHGVSIDLIRWVRFGESRVYSTMGNPDYMAGHLSLFAALWLGLGWRRMDPRGPAQAAALSLLAVPAFVVPAAYGAASIGAFLGVMGPWLAVTTLLFVSCRRASARSVWIFGLGLLGLLLVLAQGRGAWLATVLSAAVMAAAAWRLEGKAYFVRRWQVLRWPVGAALAALLVLGALLMARAAQPQGTWTKQGASGKALAVVDSLGSRVVHIFDKANDAQVVRRFYWQAAWRTGLSHPLVGVGYGSHALFTARAQSQVWKAWEQAGDPRVAKVEPHVELYTHNDLLQNFAETGLLGLAAFLLFWGYFAWAAWGLARDGARDNDSRRLDLGLGLLGLGVAFGANAMTNFPWRVQATQQLCWLAFAILALQLRPVTAEDPAPAPKRVSGEALAAGLAVSAFLALWPLRWFSASLLIRQGNAFKDAAQTQAQGIPYYEKAVQVGLSGTQRVETLLYLGSLYNVAGRPSDAEATFKRCIGYYPDFIEAWYNLGYTAQTRYAGSHDPKDLQAAADAYAHVLDVDPRSLNALNNSGNIYYQSGQLDQAKTTYERLVRFQPASLEGWYNLGATYVRLGDRGSAENALRKALEQKPDFKPAADLYQQLQHLPKNYVLPKG